MTHHGGGRVVVVVVVVIRNPDILGVCVMVMRMAAILPDTDDFR